MANVISVNTVGTGYVRSSAYDPTMTAPGATVLNFNNKLVSSNAVPLSTCVGCAFEIDVWVPSPATTHIVVDVVGYFSYAAPPGARAAAPGRSLACEARPTAQERRAIASEVKGSRRGPRDRTSTVAKSRSM